MTEPGSYVPMIHVELAQLAHQAGDAELREQELRDAHRQFTGIGAMSHAERTADQLTTAAT